MQSTNRCSSCPGYQRDRDYQDKLKKLGKSLVLPDAALVFSAILITFNLVSVELLEKDLWQTLKYPVLILFSFAIVYLALHHVFAWDRALKPWKTVQGLLKSFKGDDDASTDKEG